MKKKLLAILMTLSMVVCMMPAVSYASPSAEPIAITNIELDASTFYTHASDRSKLILDTDKVYDGAVKYGDIISSMDMKWYKGDTELPGRFPDYFYEGTVYRAVITITPKSPYVFNSNSTITLANIGKSNSSNVATIDGVDQNGVITASWSGTPMKAYDLYISGKRVNELNAADILGNGTLSYNPDTNTVTMNNAEIIFDEEANAGIEYGSTYGDKTLNIVVKGTNKIKRDASEDNAGYGIELYSDSLNISGSGKLSIENVQTGSCGIKAGESIEITDADITITEDAGGTADGFAINAENITFDGAARIDATSNSGIYAYNKITFNLSKKNGKVSSKKTGTASYLAGAIYAGNLVILATEDINPSANSRIELNADNTITTPENGIVSDVDNCSFITDSDKEVVATAVVEYTGKDDSATDPDKDDKDSTKADSKESIDKDSTKADSKESIDKDVDTGDHNNLASYIIMVGMSLVAIAIFAKKRIDSKTK